jgi:hypothetical protein
VIQAAAILDEALTMAERLGHRTFEAELQRARGEIMLKLDPADSAPAQFWRGADQAARCSAPLAISFHFRHGRSGATSSNRF